jgi:hypothetical protein
VKESESAPGQSVGEEMVGRDGNRVMKIYVGHFDVTEWFSIRRAH